MFGGLSRHTRQANVSQTEDCMVAACCLGFLGLVFGSPFSLVMHYFFMAWEPSSMAMPNTNLQAAWNVNTIQKHLYYYIIESRVLLLKNTLHQVLYACPKKVFAWVCGCYCSVSISTAIASILEYDLNNLLWKLNFKIATIVATTFSPLPSSHFW